ncbi:sigma-70 family RNA polymerase sigma factor [Burkholderia cepacia]|uniref:Sigma-70 family RNA polymerase sigma factor n=1 Tax=Burkholderia cepacia TaxID=292 RepID=A0AAX2RMJ7_BURCE|nr:sigma-70 family RNA polymerase sigma factor [Burkholderia cepacia]TES62190.1 sigma-70 family RNA polymerase sigma factor [Burkholderia cepacia]TET01618.1 sigma-70 family RNA polymerase sigma factor [Burkholderia cepacia]TEU47476.1 sigma-70 family RNA polymerase sigma factor [Burkholderia cepacia]TEU53503.1 sigma-70 family RNA polymerase sigma factor [Burkholderia cepacia]TEV02109.1 sigma-70 family RNA polymerase sigma factor [Burkholderia cepacia]
MTDEKSRRGARIHLVRPTNGPEEPPDGRAQTRADGSPDWSVLMACVQLGDRDAYRRLLESITPYLRRLVARHGVDPDAVEDVVQDILVTIHQVRHTYSAERPFGPWLVSIASRRIVDTLRRQGRAASRELPLDPDHETLPGGGANLMEEAADAHVVREALARLPPGQRDAIRMLKLEEMSLKEAALATGTTVAALKVAVHRGLKTLRKLLVKQEKRQ